METNNSAERIANRTEAHARCADHLEALARALREGRACMVRHQMTTEDKPIIYEFGQLVGFAPGDLREMFLVESDGASVSLIVTTPAGSR